MDHQEQPDRGRDSVFLLAEVAHRAQQHRIKVRNLSAGGLMAEPNFGVAVGDRLTITLKNIGSVAARVAWTTPERFGVSFANAIDPRAVRQALAADPSPPPAPPPTDPRPPLLRRL